ncbi:hypothetical protein BE08_31985 [Sorangium cellulosum]|uniref:Uncharacterized protein n=1 Tax=Sorangium cellulosum TaxID=56 RepID=A0A150PKM6_SORCE|nr:hypothetical protein BE08_31985 [Sorangium cellulosum]
MVNLSKQLFHRLSVLVLMLAMLSMQGCGGLLEPLNELPANVRKELDDLLARLDQSVETYDRTVEKQRVGLAQDMNGVIEGASLNLRTLAEQARSSVGAVLAAGKNIEENAFADLKGLVNGVITRSDNLIKALETGVDSTIRNAARELDRQRAVTLLQMNTVTQAALRPVTAQLTRSGTKMVGQVSAEINTWIVRLIGGAVILLGGLALLAGLRKQLRGLAIGAGVVAAVGVPLTLAAAPIARIGVRNVELPSGEALCEEMQKLSKSLEPFEKPKTKPRPPDLAQQPEPDKLARNFEWVGHKLRAAAPVSPMAAETARPDALASASEKENVASDVLAAASQCLTYAPNAPRAAEANQVFTRAMALLSENVFCSFMADCAAIGKACDERVQVCVDWGTYCEAHSDCSLDKACDFAKRRCVAATAPCSTPSDCRPEYACSPQVGKCLLSSEVKSRGEACDTDAPVNSPCRVGKLDVVDRWVKCVQTTSPVEEICDGIDNDCNGTIDEGQNREAGCSEGKGECQKRGTWACTNGQMVCTQAPPAPESCNNLDDDCDGTVDNVTPVACDNAPAQGECRKGHRTCGGCQPGQPSAEICDGLDNNCDGQADPAPTCPEIEIKRQGPDDNNHEMTELVSGFTAATDLIDKEKEHGGSCGIDDHGRRLVRTRAEVSADPRNGATCTLTGPYDGFTSPDLNNCRIRVRYKTTRLGSNVWCSGTWWARPVGAYLR